MLATPLSDEEVEQHLLRTVSDEAVGAAREHDDDVRISLAGAQEKDAFLFWDGRWMRPHGSTPTSHIFKMPLGLVGGRRVDMQHRRKRPQIGPVPGGECVHAIASIPSGMSTAVPDGLPDGQLHWSEQASQSSPAPSSPDH